MASASQQEMASASAGDAGALRVASGGKVHTYVERALQAMQTQPVRPCRPPRTSPLSFPSLASAQAAPLRITAAGAAVSKAVTVAEISKRRVRGLHQNTQIGLADPAGASDEAARRAPTIAITLSLAPLDPSLDGCARAAARRARSATATSSTPLTRARGSTTTPRPALPAGTSRRSARRSSRRRG
jgi:DNA-binding protein